MKVLVCTAPRHAQIFPFGRELEHLGAEAAFFYTPAYGDGASFFARRLQKLGLGNGEASYWRRLRKELFQRTEAERPDVVLFLNTVDQMLPQEELRRYHALLQQQGAKFFLWLVDPVYGREELLPTLRQYDRVFSYEERDASWLSGLGLPTSFLPLGYGADYGTVAARERDIDVLFVGTPYRSRLPLLEAIARVGRAEGWKLRFCGPFYPAGNIWKRLVFSLRHGALSCLVENGTFSPAEIAALYARAKICLNIHGNGSTGLNPRSYEILGAGSFLLVDERESYDCFVPGEDFDVYRSPEELVEKVRYYLAHPEEREKIQQQGHASAEGRSLLESLRRLLALAGKAAPKGREDALSAGESDS